MRDIYGSRRLAGHGTFKTIPLASLTSKRSAASVAVQKFAKPCGWVRSELLNQSHTSKS